MKPRDLDSLLAELRAIGEPTRLRLLALLAEGELSVKDLTTILGQSQPRVSRHLKLLVEAGLVRRSPEGAWAYYRLGGPDGALVRSILSAVDRDDPALVADRLRLETVKQDNAQSAARYFAANAASWDAIRSLHVPETAVEAALREMVGDRPVQSFLDLGTGTGRLLTLFQDLYVEALGIDSSHQMLAVARSNLDRTGIRHARVAHGDLNALDVPHQSYDLITFHQVLHYLDDPIRAIREAARLLVPGGQLVIVDFAPHGLEFLREQHAHRRLGFAHDQIERWLTEAGLTFIAGRDLDADPAKLTSLTVSIWLARDPRMIADQPAQNSNLETA